METIKTVAKKATTKQNSPFYPVVKRSMDVAGAGLGLFFLAPFLLVLILVLKISNLRAPVFFKQERIGKNGSKFMMYKFRTMIPNAEEKLAELLQYNEVEEHCLK
ncbi:Putative colanic biosynthesis UDP-glucose lipid carrier transferase [Listeria fleischmannii subsp. fleischmannii]|uniref:Colanic biosynthesis UDP-glucose lipid carrier transferase n=1 Tax=Listeria fleischmannii subsp. fleischmannii TaxID=1671902 RepID=A0A2X3HF03_9LIST|nr:Putative colanic biosynthesis UDP-glucose lipid carrier transferase [Listeria fleischmannii subsp. fleischmannii]